MISRDPAAASRTDWDLIVVGGGIHGVCVALEAARRGVRPLLLERSDFGAETSWNSLRIVHGGLRYLQSLDLARFRESVSERAWLLRHFPDLVEPVPCLMPLYGDGLRRPSVLSVALLANRVLAAPRNRTIPRDRGIPAGRVVGARRTREIFELARPEGLRGGALWYDGMMPDSQRLLVELLRSACAAGACALNRFEVATILVEGGRVRGVSAVDGPTGTPWRFEAPVVVNCAGPWARRIARDADRDVPELFRPSLGFNLLLDRAPVASAAVAVAPPRPGARTYFLIGWKGRLLAGTSHEVVDPSIRDPEAAPTEVQIGRFLDDLNAAVPGLRLERREVLRVHPGLMPATRDGGLDPAPRPIFRDHAADGGPKGFFSVSGVKWTTARRVGEQALVRIFPRRPAAPFVRAPGHPPPAWTDFLPLASRDPAAAREVVERILREESVGTLDDLLLRRTDWGTIPSDRDAARDLLTSWIGRDALPDGSGPL